MRRIIWAGGAAGFVAAAIACGSSSSGDNASDASVQDAGNANDSSFSDGSSPPDAAFDAGLAPTPPCSGALSGLTFYDGWSSPCALAPPVNTTGWEDCSYISASGSRLYFGYTQFDFDALGQGMFVADGPLRPGEIRPGFEIYEATIADGGWNVTASTVNLNDASISEAAEGVDDSETTMAFIRYDAPTNAGDVYLSKKSGGVWGTAQKLAAPINTACVEDNAALSRDGLRLYFDSNRADDLGTTCKAASDSSTRTIYVSTFDGANWGAPVQIPGAPNTGAVHWQIYPREDPTLYWAGGDTDCKAEACIYRASLESDGGYGDKTLVVQPVAVGTATPGDVIAVGEVSITRDGHWMYFTYIQEITTADGGIGANLNIGVAHHL
jgi:hypothetical protein